MDNFSGICKRGSSEETRNEFGLSLSSILIASVLHGKLKGGHSISFKMVGNLVLFFRI